VWVTARPLPTHSSRERHRFIAVTILFSKVYKPQQAPETEKRLLLTYALPQKVESICLIDSSPVIPCPELPGNVSQSLSLQEYAKVRRVKLSAYPGFRLRPPLASHMLDAISLVIETCRA
jgi:hypothetical protein